MTDRSYLIAHSDQAQAGIAQAEIRADNLAEARRKFTDQHPERRITATGVKGVEDPHQGPSV